MGTGDLRYWSFCSNQGFANTRVNECVYDESVPVGPDGYYTIVVSLPEDRPKNATEKNGVAWINWGPGEGIGDPLQLGLLFRRRHRIDLGVVEIGAGIVHVERAEDHDLDRFRIGGGGRRRRAGAGCDGEGRSQSEQAFHVNFP